MIKLVVCNTYFQLLTAIQMKLTILKHENVDLFLSDHSINAKSVATKLGELNLFNSVTFIENNAILKSDNSFLKIINLFKLNFLKINNNNGLAMYDEVIFFNYDIFIYGLADTLKKYKKTTIWSRFEEGLLSYDTDYHSGLLLNLNDKIRRVTKRPVISTDIKNYYCFFPKLKNNPDNWNILQIPSISNNKDEFVAIINKIFDYKENPIKQRYIYFASSSDIDGNCFGETDFVLELANKVGKENLLVKTHPRDTRKIYQDNAISVMENSFIPWEVFQLNNNFEDKRLLTIHSGSFLGITSILNDNTQGYFLFSLIKDNDSVYLKNKNAEIVNLLNKIHSIDLSNKIEICNDIENLLK